MRSFQTVSKTHSFDSLNRKQKAHLLLGFIWIKNFKEVSTIKPSLEDIQLCIDLAHEWGQKKEFLSRYQSYLNWTVLEYNKV